MEIKFKYDLTGIEDSIIFDPDTDVNADVSVTWRNISVINENGNCIRWLVVVPATILMLAATTVAGMPATLISVDDETMKMLIDFSNELIILAKLSE
jgi:hypothetical protein